MLRTVLLSILSAFIINLAFISILDANAQERRERKAVEQQPDAADRTSERRRPAGNPLAVAPTDKTIPARVAPPLDTDSQAGENLRKRFENATPEDQRKFMKKVEERKESAEENVDGHVRQRLNKIDERVKNLPPRKLKLVNRISNAKFGMPFEQLGPRQKLAVIHTYKEYVAGKNKDLKGSVNEIDADKVSDDEVDTMIQSFDTELPPEEIQ